MTATGTMSRNTGVRASLYEPIGDGAGVLEAQLQSDDVGPITHGVRQVLHRLRRERVRVSTGTAARKALAQQSDQACGEQRTDDRGAERGADLAEVVVRRGRRSHHRQWERVLDHEDQNLHREAQADTHEREVGAHEPQWRRDSERREQSE